MGSSLSPILSNIVLNNIESEILASPAFQFVRFYRYADDCLVLYKDQSTLENLYTTFNPVHTSIKFTLEKENNGCLNFLDLLIKRKNNKFVTAVYHKPNAGLQYIHNDSFHPWQQKSNIWKNFYRRAILLSDLTTDLEKEVQFITDIGQKNGYDKNTLTNWYKQVSCNLTKSNLPKQNSEDKKYAGIPYFSPISTKIKRIFNKENIVLSEIPPKNIEKNLTLFKSYYVNPDQSSGVYSVHCQCGDEYIGVTKRNLSTRIKEHTRDAQKDIPNMSGLSQHLKETQHSIHECRILENARTAIERNIKETFYILRNKTN